MENTPALWLKKFPWPEADGHKYDRGHAVILGGCVAATGATKLAAFCALRSGAGLVSVSCDAESLPIYGASFQAVMTKKVETLPAFSKLISDAHVTAVLLGPGAGVTARTKSFTLTALQLKKPTVLDADTLTCFAKRPSLLFAAINGPTILTPHEGEFARLFTVQGERGARALAAAKLSGAVVVLKGAVTIIAAPDGRVAMNRNAPPTLATAGAGDALAGICTGLLAQGMEAFDAACAAVWLHGSAANSFGPGLIADDIAGLLPAALRELQSQT